MSSSPLLRGASPKYVGFSKKKILLFQPPFIVHFFKILFGQNKKNPSNSLERNSQLGVGKKTQPWAGSIPHLTDLGSLYRGRGWQLN
jgi:hypothetical protein